MQTIKDLNGVATGKKIGPLLLCLGQKNNKKTTENFPFCSRPQSQHTNSCYIKRMNRNGSLSLAHYLPFSIFHVES